MRFSSARRFGFALGLLVLAAAGAAALPLRARYVALAWNDLGMHCLNPSYDTAVLLPPYNTVWVQVVRRGNPPRLVTAGLTVSYRIAKNTRSYGKKLFGQFWDNCQKLFGVSLARDTGLNLEDPSVHNGLSGTMLVKGSHFQANGIPVTPIEDSGTWNPYQLIEITVKEAGAVVATTQATIPSSDELNCTRCHGTDPFRNLLAAHDRDRSTSLSANLPVLCASCHGSPALGSKDAGPVGVYLSQAIHRFHADKGAACYDCHPGAKTRCSRSVAHTAADGNCITCHGGLEEVAASIGSGRTPWLHEPACSTCHSGVAGVDTGASLYRNAAGHGGVLCAACHGSPHAMLPSLQGMDNIQALALQGKALSIGSCRACHRSGRGEGLEEFAETHGSGGEAPNACYVCHTGFLNAGATKSWPHAFQWKDRR